MNTINNLTEMLNGDTPYHYGRSLYKYTSCGPWISYIMLVSPAYNRVANLSIGKKNGKLAIITEIEQYDEKDNVTEDDRIFLGFTKDGKKDLEVNTIKGYLKLVKDFIKDKNHSDKKVELLDHGKNYIDLAITQEVREVTKDVSYESNDVNNIDFTKCVGVKIGSIVEGSDAEIGPYELRFPFTEDELDSTVKTVDDEASFYWERDNLTWLIIKKNGESVGWAKSKFWGGWEVDESLPKKVQNAIDKLSDIGEGGKIPNCKGYTYELDDSMAMATY